MKYVDRKPGFILCLSISNLSLHSVSLESDGIWNINLFYPQGCKQRNSVLMGILGNVRIWAVHGFPFWGPNGQIGICPNERMQHYIYD